MEMVYVQGMHIGVWVHTPMCTEARGRGRVPA